MDLAQYIALKQRQQLVEGLGGIAATEGRGYRQNVQSLSRASPDPFTRLGRAAGLVMTAGMARRAALQQAATTSAGRAITPAVQRAQSVVRRRLAREKQFATAFQKIMQQDRARTAAILKKMTALETSVKTALKKKKRKK